MDHAAYTDIVAEQSARFLAVLRRADPDGVVPSTPAWTVADLVWHLAEVQWFWGAIVSDLLEDVDALTEPDRPEGAALVDLLRRSSADLVGALRERDPADTCWSWHEDGRSVGWVARRQAHEALIHRVDAELAAGVPVSAAPAELAADGVDELLRVMLKLPSWGTFTPDGCAVRV
ncbi:MAG: maleylpyruvate isomerase family mycothiol-dependent enzyme, partial [Nitriliruptor sp.]